MPKRRNGRSRNNGGSPSRPKQRSGNPARYLDALRATMLSSALETARNMGVSPTSNNAVVIVSKDDPQVVIHTPGQVGNVRGTYVSLLSRPYGIVMIAYTPSWRRSGELPGALFCFKHFRNKPSESQIRRITTQEWRIGEYEIV